MERAITFHPSSNLPRVLQKSSCFLSERKASSHAELAILPTVNHHPFSKAAKLLPYTHSPLTTRKITALQNWCHVSNMFSIMMQIIVSTRVNITVLSQDWEEATSTTI